MGCHLPSQIPWAWDAEAAPWDATLLGTRPFIFLKLLPNLLPLLTGHTSLATVWVLAGLASWEDTVIKAILNLL